MVLIQEKVTTLWSDTTFFYAFLEYHSQVRRYTFTSFKNKNVFNQSYKTKMLAHNEILKHVGHVSLAGMQLDSFSYLVLHIAMGVDFIDYI